MTENINHQPTLAERVTSSRKKIRARLGVSTVSFVAAIIEAPDAGHPGLSSAHATEVFIGASAIGLGAAGLAYREMMAQSKLSGQDNPDNRSRFEPEQIDLTHPEAHDYLAEPSQKPSE